VSDAGVALGKGWTLVSSQSLELLLLLLLLAFLLEAVV
jgi:hypothetical protein